MPVEEHNIKKSELLLAGPNRTEVHADCTFLGCYLFMTTVLNRGGIPHAPWKSVGVHASTGLHVRHFAACPAVSAFVRTAGENRQLQ